MPRVTIGISLKMYFGHKRARAWFAEVAKRVRAHRAVAAGDVELFITPTFLQVIPAIAAFEETPVLIGAQDVAATGSGAYTGEVSAAELFEVGARIAEIGHAERRRLFGETDAIAAAKTREALAVGLTPLICIGETDPQDAAVTAVSQLTASLAGAPAGPIIVAYEPVWAIGAPEPAGTEHIRTAAAALRSALRADPHRAGSRVIYGGAAGPGLLSALGDSVDGLFLGRFAHDPDALVTVLDEAAVLARARS